jgi:hypothetical protein
MSVHSEPWPPSYAFEAHKATRSEVRGLLTQADRLLADAGVALVSAESRHALAHNAVVMLAKLALSASGWRTSESHHYWCIASLSHTVGLGEDDVEALQAHRSKRHRAAYSPEPMVSLTELADLLERAGALRTRVVAWLGAEHAGLWGPETG